MVLKIHEIITEFTVHQSSISAELSAGRLMVPSMNLIFFFARREIRIALAHSSKLGPFNCVCVIKLPGLSFDVRVYGDTVLIPSPPSELLLEVSLMIGDKSKPLEKDML